MLRCLELLIATRSSPAFLVEVHHAADRENGNQPAVQTEKNIEKMIENAPANLHDHRFDAFATSPNT